MPNYVWWVTTSHKRPLIQNSIVVGMPCGWPHLAEEWLRPLLCRWVSSIHCFKPPASKHLTVGLILCTEKGATLLHSELNSDVERFTDHIKPVFQQIRLLTGWTWLVKQSTSLSTRFTATRFFGNTWGTFNDNMALFVLKLRDCIQWIICSRYSDCRKPRQSLRILDDRLREVWL